MDVVVVMGEKREEEGGKVGGRGEGLVSNQAWNLGGAMRNATQLNRVF